jgi:hypothetical protein
MNYLDVIVAVGLFLGLAVAIILEQYAASLVLLGLAFLLALKVAIRFQLQAPKITVVPAHQIKILGLQEIKEKTLETTCETKTKNPTFPETMCQALH